MKTLVFCTSYADNLHDWEIRQGLWIKSLHRSGLQFDQLLIVDDGSPVLPSWPDTQIVCEQEVSAPDDVLSSAAVLIYTHQARLGRQDVFVFPGWYRSFAFGVLYGASHGFEKIIHIESDAHLISSRIQDHFNRFTSGWFSVWCKKYQMPEIAIQAAAGSEVGDMAEFVKTPYSQLSGRLHETILPFSHVERTFIGDRYGEVDQEVPKEADFSSQTRLGKNDDYYWWIPSETAVSKDTTTSFGLDRRKSFGADMDRQDLEHLAVLHGSDKHGAHFYMQHYAKFFREFRDKTINLLEIGVGGYDAASGGGSLKVWQDYFPFGTIIGLDIHDKRALTGGRIKVFKGSQIDPCAISTILNSLSGSKIDIIIDDGSHLNEDVMVTFGMLFPYLAPHGLYFIEDLQTSYLPNFGGSFSDLSTAKTTMNFLKGLTDGLNWQEIHRPLYRPTFADLNIVGISFYHNIVFIEKGDNREGSNTLTDNCFPGFS